LAKVVRKADLVAAVADRTGLTKRQAGETLEVTLGTIRDTLAEGGRVQLAGFGNFEVRERKERMGINPATKAPIMIAASKAPVFRPGKSLKDAVS
jgi:DNA-binding protein HU-beta